MTKEIESVYVNEPLGLGVGIFGIYKIDDLEAYMLTSILNSKFITYYFSEKFKDKALSGGYLALNKNIIYEIPFINPTDQIRSKSINISKEIHHLKKENPESDTTALESKIDHLAKPRAYE